MSQWFYALHGTQHGPVTVEALRSMLGRILTWVRAGYADKVGERFPEARSPRPSQKAMLRGR